VGSKTYSPIARVEVARLRKELDELVTRCENLDPSDEVRSDAYRYAYVRLAGYLEQSLASVGRAVCHQQSGGKAQRFGLSWLERVQNPKAGEVEAFVRRFDAGWADELKEWLAEDERGNTLSSLVGLRNDIAHGKASSGSSSNFTDYYVVVVELVDWLLERFDPAPATTT
jgi:hypothetical protein